MAFCLARTPLIWSLVFGLWAMGPPTIISGTLDMQTYNGFIYIMCVWYGMCACTCGPYNVGDIYGYIWPCQPVIQQNSLLCRCSNFHIFRSGPRKCPFVLVQRLPLPQKNTVRKFRLDLKISKKYIRF